MINSDLIHSFQIWHVSIPFKSTMRSSRGTLDTGEKVILQLTTQSGVTGLGEASVIFPSRSGEYGSTIFSALKELYCPKLIGKNPLHIQRIMADLETATSERYAFLATKTAIDLALHDLKARLLGISVADLLGGASRTALPLSRSLSIMPDDKLIKTAQTLADQGYRLLTLKGTKDWQGNITTFKKLRTALPDDVMLEIDPNQAWQPKEAIAVDRALFDLGLLCIEQPCAWYDYEGLKQVNERTLSQTAADEAILSPADLLHVIKLGAADTINIKLAKSGGILNSALMVEMASHAGLNCNMGSKHPLGVGSAALLHFAAAYPDVGEFIGYGSALERFSHDIIQETLIIEDGKALLPEGPGLGVTLDPNAMNQFSIEHYNSIDKAAL